MPRPDKSTPDSKVFQNFMSQPLHDGTLYQEPHVPLVGKATIQKLATLKVKCSNDVTMDVATPQQLMGVFCVFNRNKEEFADWDVKHGDRTYRLHRLDLSKGANSSAFFAGAFNGDYEAKCTDLTNLLPLACHGHFESALDFIYGTKAIPV